MRITGVDFETYYDKEVSLKIQGTYNYCRHPKFEAYMVTISTDDDQEYIGRPENFDWAAISGEGEIWVSHNKSFDRTVFEWLLETGKIDPCEGPEDWHCSADLAAYLGLPRSLANAVKFLYDVDLDKSTRDKMKGKSWEEMTEEFKAEVSEYAMDDAYWCRRIFQDYGSKWPEQERQFSEHTAMMGNRGVPIDFKKLEDGIATLNTKIWEAEQEIPWDWDPAARTNKTPLSPKALAKECRKHGIEPPKSLAMDSPDCEEWEATYGAKFPWVEAMRVWRRGNMIRKKLQAMERRVKADGWMAYGQLYFGAHTGRDSGSGGVNMQNLPRDEIFGVNVRKMIVAPPGFKFISADYSQIEARITAWYAGDEAFLKQIQEGIDPYEAHARATMGYKDPRPLKEVDNDMRQLAKARVLALGFGCGAGQFKVMAKVMFGLDLTPKECKQIVRDFRNTTLIPKLWKKLEQGFWRTRDKDHQIEMPNGRCLTYRNIKRRGDEYSQCLIVAIPGQGGFRNTKVWGGKLCENLVQATARDIFIDGVLRLEYEAGIPVIMRIHDEVLCCVPEDEAEQARKKVEETLSIAPEWMGNLPVKAEAEIMDFYEK